ncbi:MAG: penicillin acylase family protein [Actinobacteria bacterium]|nr:penicillin acylase family protein [Actinomycetota bacterium]MCG2800862.1 penicillin acylase family protein [Cellulomonas sp.]
MTQGKGARTALRRTIVVVACVLVLVVVGLAGAAWWVVRAPLPTVDGDLRVAGLDGQVAVTRDARGVPTVVAGTAHDLFMAQGYVAAQDRFFEMDYRRHVTAGRLSELVGADAKALAADKVVRTLGWRRVAEQEWELAAPATRGALQAYADGVNAYLEGRSPARIAVEYTVLGLKVDVAAPERWDPVDSLAWLKAMAWDLRSNYDDELTRARAYSTLADVASVDALFPAYPQDLNAPILAGATGSQEPPSASGADLGLTSEAAQGALTSAQAALDAVPHLLGEGQGIGSNSWVVSGAYTTSGLPLLANDPHLSVSAPGIWMQVGLRCAALGPDCPYDVSGFSFAGFPGVIIGHNGELAWALTNLGADVTDFFLEKVTGGAALVDGARVALTSRTETIKVAGGDPVTITVRSTRHGPIVSDVLNLDAVARVPAGGVATQVALAWTALTPNRSADAVLALDTARDAADVQAAAALFAAPAQNILFATTDGHIGYQAPGLVPVRARVVGSSLPSDGSWPRPGWDSAYDWQGYVEPDRLPRTLDPPQGYIVAANQAVTPAGTGPFLTNDWDYGFRAQRIRALLVARLATGKVDVADMQTIATDARSAAADVLVPQLIGLDIGTGFDADGQALLRTWDRQMDADSPAAVYFAAVLQDVLAQTFSDNLPTEAALDGDSRSVELLREVVDDPSSTWWDDSSTPRVVEGRDEILTRALVSARLELTARLGKDPSTWAWGTVHTIAPEHPVLGGDAVPALVRSLMNPDPRPVGGGSAVVDATAWDASSGSFDVVSAPSMRMVVDLSDLDSSTWVTLTGSSGHPGSTHYADQLTAWSTGLSYPWPFTAAAVEADAADRLTLTP